MAPLFIGRAFCTFQDILLGTTERELVLFSHTKRHERGNVSIQLSIAVPQVKWVWLWGIQGCG